MRFSLFCVAAFATAVVAAPSPVAEADPWCTHIGQPCWKEKMMKKRDPSPVAEPDPWCTHIGQPCWKEKMKKRDPSPVAEPDPWCTHIGQPCWKEKMKKRDPSPVAEPAPWCTHIGQPCWKAKRAADAFAEAIQSSGGLQARSPEADVSNSAGGAAYNAKRQINDLAHYVSLSYDDPYAFYTGLGLDQVFDADTEAADEVESTDNEKREAEPEAEPWCMHIGQPCWKSKRAADEDKRWCMHIGQPCWKAKRAAEAVVEAIKRDAEPEASPDPWCMHIGQPCWKSKREADEKRWCMHIGQPCWKAKRDLQAVGAMARDIVASYEE